MTSPFRFPRSSSLLFNPAYILAYTYDSFEVLSIPSYLQRGRSEHPSWVSTSPIHSIHINPTLTSPPHRFPDIMINKYAKRAWWVVFFTRGCFFNPNALTLREYHSSNSTLISIKGHHGPHRWECLALELSAINKVVERAEYSRSPRRVWV